jgi:hypothetical protein
MYDVVEGLFIPARRSKQWFSVRFRGYPCVLGSRLGN